MDLFPNTLFCPDAKVVIAGFPVRQVIGHHTPTGSGADDVKNTINNVPSGILGGSPSELGITFWEKLYK